MNLFPVTLIHEFIHARDAAKYGCPPWDNPDYPWGTNEQQTEQFTREHANGLTWSSNSTRHPVARRPRL